MDEIRLGVIGSGFMGRTNAETITKYLKGARLVSIAGGTRAPKLAEEYQVKSDPTVESLLKRKDVDAVFISTPHSEHATQAIMLRKTESTSSSISRWPPVSKSATASSPPPRNRT